MPTWLVTPITLLLPWVMFLRSCRRSAGPPGPAWYVSFRNALHNFNREPPAVPHQEITCAVIKPKSRYLRAKILRLDASIRRSSFFNPRQPARMSVQWTRRRPIEKTWPSSIDVGLKKDRAVSRVRDFTTQVRSATCELKGRDAARSISSGSRMRSANRCWSSRQESRAREAGAKLEKRSQGTEGPGVIVKPVKGGFSRSDLDARVAFPASLPEPKSISRPDPRRHPLNERAAAFQNPQAWTAGAATIVSRPAAPCWKRHPPPSIPGSWCRIRRGPAIDGVSRTQTINNKSPTTALLWILGGIARPASTHLQSRWRARSIKSSAEVLKQTSSSRSRSKNHQINHEPPQHRISLDMRQAAPIRAGRVLEARFLGRQTRFKGPRPNHPTSTDSAPLLALEPHRGPSIHVSEDSGPRRQCSPARSSPPLAGVGGADNRGLKRNPPDPVNPHLAPPQATLPKSLGRSSSDKYPPLQAPSSAIVQEHTEFVVLLSRGLDGANVDTGCFSFTSPLSNYKLLLASRSSRSSKKGDMVRAQVCSTSTSRRIRILRISLRGIKQRAKANPFVRGGRRSSRGGNGGRSPPR